MNDAMTFKVGTTTYRTGSETDPMKAGHSQFVLVNADGVPLLMEWDSGHTEYVSFNRVVSARSRAREINRLSDDHPQIGVFDKRKAQVVFAA